MLCSLDELCLIVPFCHSCSGPQDNQTGLIVPHSLLQPGSDLTPLTSHSHYLRLLLIYLINSCLASPPPKSIMAGRFTKLLHQVTSVRCGVSAHSDVFVKGEIQVATHFNEHYLHNVFMVILFGQTDTVINSELK